MAIQIRLSKNARTDLEYIDDQIAERITKNSDFLHIKIIH